MKESIGQAFIMNLILFFFGILVLLYFGSINYSKAYKAKNKIVNTIEKYGGWDDPESPNTPVKDEVYLKLEQGGYQTVVITGDDLRKKCAAKVLSKQKRNVTDKDIEDLNIVYPESDELTNRRYEFCVIEHKASRGSYYQVVTFMRFEVPVVGNLLNPAIYGETAVLYDNPGLKTEEGE
jgi:hypothetical protein